MTKRELDCHWELRQQLAEALELLAALEAKAAPRLQRLDGMPHAPGFPDPVGDLAAEIADMRETVAQLRVEIDCSEAAITAYIQTIADARTRMIFRLRFIRGLAWCEVAGVLGAGNTENAVKNICYRYLARGGPACMVRPPKVSIEGKRHEKVDV